jgi:hypothetical protein
MYSGTTLTKYSGRVLGAHQKIDRVARKQLAKVLPNNNVFPKSRKILHFEGVKGPDAIKRKSPAHDEPWHYFNPFDEADTQLQVLIEDHYKKIVKELKAGNVERTAFEAAWLAHALVDGLTPAHHYPYEEKLTELRGGEGRETRTTVKTKVILPGHSRSAKFKNNWKMYGAKGLFLTHGLFEMGVATLIAPLGFGEVTVTKKQLHDFSKKGIAAWFRDTAREVAVLEMYENYYQKGWTPKLAWQVRHRLGPIMVHSVMLAWYAALLEAGLVTL